MSSRIIKKKISFDTNDALLAMKQQLTKKKPKNQRK